VTRARSSRQPNPGSLVDQDRDFFVATVPEVAWVEFAVAPTSFTQARVRFHARGQAGDLDAAFDFAASLKSFTDAGLADDGAPVAVGDIAVAAGEPTFVFLRGGSGDSVRVTATGEGGLDLTLEQIDRTEAPPFARNLTGADGAESFARVVGADGFIAMRVTAAGGAAGTFDLDAEVADLAESPGTTAPAVVIPDDDPDGVDDVIALAASSPRTPRETGP
jgi:hypothetical protein